MNHSIQSKTHALPLRQGIISVIQIPFGENGAIDFFDLDRLIEDAIASGTNGFLAPVVASEVAYLTAQERRAVVERVAGRVQSRVPFIAGASSDNSQSCIEYLEHAAISGAHACLVAVPPAFYRQPERILPFFKAISRNSRLPLLIQDFEFNGPGMSLSLIGQLRQQLPNLVGIKIETVPAGPKYTAVRQICGSDFFVAGGWAVPQMIEALDRGVDAMIPESSMVRVYAKIVEYYASGQRDSALKVFRALLPVLAFTNQDVATSIAFFKRLLVRKNIFKNAAIRWQGFQWDPYNERIAEELIDYTLQLEKNLGT
ncbi:dihydrodipicolinate synthase family protein [candidate division KSB1 bacterium]|nr:dihydrodipicolinate synthase family protein [candidate division KSB1 bacterium]